MMQRTIPIFLLALSLLVWGCGTTAPAVATVGSETISLKEYETSYAKNNGGPDSGRVSTQKQREDFLDLLVKFRLKVAEAKDRSIDQLPEIRTEIYGYELSVAETYMVEKELIDPNVRMLYDRKKEELRASHILIRTDLTSPPEDTLKAYQKAMDVIRQIPDEDFDSLVARYSEEPNVEVTKGDLGYFSIGRMVPEFEDAAFSLRPGEHTRIPVRTQYGYHVIKLKERLENKGQVRISFVIMYYPQGGDTAAVKDSAWMLYTRLKAGEDFAAIARQYSHDKRTGFNGGDVGYYDKERLPPLIAEVLTRTPKDSVSEPLFLQNGLYIFKVTDLKGIPSFDAEQQSLRQMYRQMRYEKDYANFIHAMKQRYGLSFNISTRYALEHAFPDTTKSPADSAWDAIGDPDLLSEVLMTYQGGRVTVAEALTLIGAKPEFQVLALSPLSVERMIDQLATQIVLLEHARTASTHHEEFTALMDEYRNGILLYQVEQEEVWNKIQVNDSLLRVFHAPRKEKYRLPPRVNIAEIYVTTDSLAQIVLRRIDAGEDFLTVAEDMTMRAGFRDKKGVWGFQPYSTNDMTQKAESIPVDSVSLPFRNGAGWSMIKVLAKDSARTKLFEEASLEVTSEYQEVAAKEREQAWVEELRAKFGVVVNKDMLMQAFRQEERGAQ